MKELTDVDITKNNKDKLSPIFYSKEEDMGVSLSLFIIIIINCNI